MSASTREPLELCRPCGQQTHAAWGFCDNDIYCAMCGQQILHIQIAEELATEGEWVPIFVSGETASSVLHVRVFRSTRNRPIGAADLVPIEEVIDWQTSSVTFEDPRIGQMSMKLDVPKGAKRDAEGWVAVNVTLNKFTNKKVNIPANGISGQLIINGMVRRVRNARLLRRPTLPPWFAVNGASVTSEPLEIRGYQDENGNATIKLDLSQVDRRIVISQILGLEKLPSTEYKKATIDTPLPLLVELNRTTSVKVTIKATLNPQPETITLRWYAQGTSEVMQTPIKLNLRRLPPLEFEPRSPLFRDVYLGEKPSVVDLLLKTGNSPTQENLRLGEATISLDPKEGRWLEFDADPRGLEIPSSSGFDSHHVPVRLLLDTSRLNRQGDQPRDLIANITFRDESGAEYPYEIRAKARRLPPLLEPVAMDWGTTNTCLARGDGVNRAAVSIKMSDRQDDLERFSSDIFFEDLSDPDHPIFHIGDEAIRLSRRYSREECWIRSLKRKFLAAEPVFVRDIQGREWEYPVEVLTKMTILKLIEIAERQLGREIHTLGITFPTKWTAKARRRFTEVIREVRNELSTSRSPIKISLYEPTVDEANAVALQILTMGYASQFKRPFTVLAYDFGGGTIDTSIVRIEMDPDTYELKTTYLGIGGLGSFGGDEVTRAIVLLLKQKLDNALKEWGGYEIPIHRDGLPPNETLRSSGQLFLDARRNWGILWGFAERIKYRFCDTLTAENDPVKKVIEDNLTEITCHQSGKEDRPSLFHVLQSPTSDQDWKSFFDAIEFGLKEVCEFSLEEGKTIQSQVEDTFLELKQQLVDAGLEEPDLVVLAGGGCRLPLVREVTQKYFPKVSQTDCTLYDPKFAKQRVAHGKVVYLNMSESTNAAEGLGLSVSVLHRPLALVNPGALFGEGEKAKMIVPVGASVENREEFHEFEFGGNQLRKIDLPLYVRYWGRGEYRETVIGRFPLTEIEVNPKARFRGQIRISRTETDIAMELWVLPKEGTEQKGPFPFVKMVRGPLDEWLQGVWSNTIAEEGA